MANYTYFVALQTTGQIVGELELTGAEFTKQLGGGSMRATVQLVNLPANAQRDVIEMTTPGKYSIVVDRDGFVFGEWLIWTRTRDYVGSTLTINGSEVISHLDQREIPQWAYLQADQLLIATQIATEGFRTLAMNFPAFTPSGRLRDRHYDYAEQSIGTRLKELSQVIDGFDYDVVCKWTSVGGLRYVQRDFLLYYPRKAKPQPFVFDVGDLGGNISALAISEDARTYASQSIALGGENEQQGKVIATSTVGDVWQPQGYPFREQSKTWFSVVEQATIQNHADALQALGQVKELPADVDVFADAHPAVMDYDTGDLVLINADASDTFPDGWGGQMRIIGITLKPSVSGSEDIATLSLTPFNALPGTNEDTD
jgi:hypothetical protein